MDSSTAVMGSAKRSRKIGSACTVRHDGSETSGSKLQTLHASTVGACPTQMALQCIL